MVQAYPRVFGIVPAAGWSRRMGRTKQVMPIRGRPMLMATVEPLLGSTLDGVMVVTRREIAEALGLSRFAELEVVLVERSAEMIDSVRAGLAAWPSRRSVGSQDGYLVCPGDQPGIGPSDVDACVTAFRTSPGTIVVAEHAGRRGHPIIFPASDVLFVRSHTCDSGLRVLPRAFAERVVVVRCATRAVTRDVDTPDDYAGRDDSATKGGS